MHSYVFSGISSVTEGSLMAQGTQLSIAKW